MSKKVRKGSESLLKLTSLTFLEFTGCSKSNILDNCESAWDIHRIIEWFMLEKLSKIIQSNC